MYSLEDRIRLPIEHCKKYGFLGSRLQYYLSDSFYRFIFDNNADDMPVIDCIKQFDKDQQMKDRYDELTNKYNIQYLDENNRLLLIKCITVEKLLSV